MTQPSSFRSRLRLILAVWIFSGAWILVLGASPLALRTATVERATLPVLIETTGTVRPVQRAVIAAKVMGTIESLPITLGQRVRAGDVLAHLSAGEISARVLQAESQLDLARRDLERERELLAKGAATAEHVKALENRLATASAQLREAEAMLGYTTITAPFDGVIARRPAHAGDLAVPGQPLLELEGLDRFEIEADIPDTLAASLVLETPLEIEIPASGLRFTATLAELSSAADATARTVPAKLRVPPGTAVRSGQFARVQVPAGSASVILAPATAITRFGQMERVFVAVNGRAILRLVKTGATRGERVEILSGLDAGEQVVAAPPASLRDGAPLAPQP